MRHPSAEQPRIFIGLWPDASTRAALGPWSAAALQHCGGRALHPDQWHITLAFLGRLSPAAVQKLCTEAARWRLPRAPFRVNCYGHFERARIVWAGSQDPQSQQHLAATYQQLWHCLQPLGYQPESRPFVPHISLLRQARFCDVQALPPREPFVWQSAHCYVVESRPTEQSTQYIPVCSIPLQGPKIK